MKDYNTCVTCKKDYWVKGAIRRASSKFCSKPCQRGIHHPNWKGGRKINSQGYVLIHNPDHRYADKQGYVREHRLVMEKELGKPIHPRYDVHHINGDKKDNRPENLQVLTSLQHDRLHGQLKPNSNFDKRCIVCNRKFTVDSTRRKGKWEPKSCSRRCYWASKSLH